ncbi:MULTISPECIES: hypothetical protein [Lactobacillaceae]|jgi:hypothetical protein|uniref:hypothetical protein n=1 Tax=Ligilactobacillus murinus TaxID=1622 RepID=UPI00096E7FC9|nr:hypothetical protein [Ligilactobacillus murinus]MCR1879923.1 hypothetical protein [Ligilactobacillus murinus]TGY53940.1 hypothetical protein E5341_00575 [Ligilactobacillus murinus]HAB49796.1 hypothetical protein [Lactobacillus sp.]HAP22895.1 hypothetical protein [Lactobacillus sp.]
MKKYFELLTSAKKRNKLHRTKEVNKLNELEKLSDQELMIEKIHLLAKKSTHRTLSILYGAWYLLIIGVISVGTFEPFISYLSLLTDTTASKNKILEVKSVFYVTSGVSLLLAIILTIVFIFLIGRQRKNQQLLGLYEFEELRRKIANSKKISDHFVS